MALFNTTMFLVTISIWYTDKKTTHTVNFHVSNVNFNGILLQILPLWIVSCNTNYLHTYIAVVLWCLCSHFLTWIFMTIWSKLIICPILWVYSAIWRCQLHNLDILPGNFGHYKTKNLLIWRLWGRACCNPPLTTPSPKEKFIATYLSLLVQTCGKNLPAEIYLDLSCYNCAKQNAPTFTKTTVLRIECKF